MPAREFLKGLPGFVGVADVVTALEPLLHQIATVSRLRRFGLVAGCAALPLLACFGLIFGSYAIQRSERQQPGIWELSQLLSVHSSRHLPWMRQSAGPDDRTFSIYIASHYRELITNSNQWRSLYAFSMIKGPGRTFAEQSVVDFPNPSEQEVDDAVAEIEPILQKLAPTNAFAKDPWFPLMAFGISLIIYVALPAMLAALLFRGGLILRALRIAVVRSDGRPASRLRLCWRGIVSWAPVLLWPVGFFLLKPTLGATGAAAVLMAFVASVVLCSILLPGRTLQDRLAGTFLVPR
jgi:hypothetical protein